MTTHVDLQEERDRRVNDTAEVFTPPDTVSDMLDILPKKTWKPGKTYLDPACGNGNILVGILIRKIEMYKHKPLDALKTVYGADNIDSNVDEARLRLLKVVAKHEPITEAHVVAVLKRVVCADFFKYDFEFAEDPDPAEVEFFLQHIQETKVFDIVEI